MKVRTNRDRANRAGLALAEYLQGDHLDESSVRDLLTDLFHLLRTKNKVVSYELRLAIDCFMEEFEEEKPVNDRALRLASDTILRTE